MDEGLNRAIDNLPAYERLRCRNPQLKNTHGRPTLYFPHMDYDERIPPTEEDADRMCRTAGVMCPIAQQCLALGLALRAPSGVWGGRVLVDGEIYRTNKKDDK